MIDAIIALIRGVRVDVDAARAGAHGRAVRVHRDPGQLHPRHAAAPARRSSSGQKLRDEFDELRATIAELESILADDDEAARRHQGRARPRSATSTATTGAPQITIDPGDLADARPHRRRRARRRAVAQGLREDRRRPTRSARQGRGGRGVRGGNLRDEDYVEHLLTTTAHSYLLFFSNRGRVVPAARARDPDEGAHRARHRAREPHRARSPTSTSRRSSTPAPTRTARTCSSPPATAW